MADAPESGASSTGTHPLSSRPYYAAVDLGSNSFHMVIARLSPNGIEVIDREKQMVQIARGLREDGTLSDEAQVRAFDCLHQFSERLRNIPSTHVRAVATKTLRAARNPSKFLKQAEAILGVRIQIISGYEEARLVYLGLAHTVSGSQQRLVVDIGGGSTEFIVGRAAKPLKLESLALGCVTFTQRFLADGISTNGLNMIYAQACAELEQIRREYQNTGWAITYGTSGTIKAIGELLSESDGGAVITRTSLHHCFDTLIETGELNAPNASKLRREVLPAGIALLRAIFDQLKIEQIHVSGATLKEGVLYDTLGRLSNHDSRVTTVEYLVHHYGIDRGHADRVKSTAVGFWRAVKAPALSGVSRTKILAWAAMLHEIGLRISHSGYHHHGHYILKHSDLAGFGRYEQFILANLVRLHRRKLTHSRLEAGIDEAAREAFIAMLLCLRLAVLLHRRREAIASSPQLSGNFPDFSLSLSPDWLAENPLTAASLEQEQSYFSQLGVTLELKI